MTSGMVLGNSLEDRRLPGFFVIGAPKTATTTVYAYFRQHPELFLPERKEPRFYSADFPGGKIAAKEEYVSLYRQNVDHRLAGDMSPTYLLSKTAWEQIPQEFPKAKICIFLREPVARALSHFVMMANGRDGHLYREDDFYSFFLKNVGEAAKFWGYSGDFRLDVIAQSFYSENVRRWKEACGEDRVRVMIYEDFLQAPQAWVDELCSFLEISSFPVDATIEKNAGARGVPRLELIHRFIMRDSWFKKAAKAALPKGWRKKGACHIRNLNMRAKPSLTPDEKRELYEFFAEDVDRLSGELRRDLHGLWGAFKGVSMSGLAWLSFDLVPCELIFF